MNTIKLLKAWVEKQNALVPIKAAEECSELSAALCRFDVCHGKVRDQFKIVEEMADVAIMLKQLEIWFDCEKELSHIVEFKLAKIKALMPGYSDGEEQGEGGRERDSKIPQFEGLFRFQGEHHGSLRLNPKDLPEK